VHKNKSFFIECIIFRIENKDKRAKTIFGVFEFECNFNTILKKVMAKSFLILSKSYDGFYVTENQRFNLPQCK